jgi:hypothetical protein
MLLFRAEGLTDLMIISKSMYSELKGLDGVVEGSYISI